MEHSEAYERRWWILGVLCLSLLVIGLDNTILNVALPTLSRDLGATNSQLQWMVDPTRWSSPGCCSPRAASGTGTGAARRLALGLVIFGIGSLFSAFSGIIERPDRQPRRDGHRRRADHAGHAVDHHQRLPRRERGRAIGIWAGVAGLGIALGPIVGGLLLEHFWWGSVFLVNVPVVIVALDRSAA